MLWGAAKFRQKRLETCPWILSSKKLSMMGSSGRVGSKNGGRRDVVGEGMLASMKTKTKSF